MNETVTVLVVDDSRTDQMLIGRLLERGSSYQVLYAHDGLDALRVIKENSPHVVVTDLQMPRMNGLELLSELRSSYPHISVIIATGYGSEEIAVQAMQAGAASYCSKTAIATRLTQTVQSVLDVSNEDLTTEHLDRVLDSQTISLHLQSTLEPLPEVLALLQHPLSLFGISDVHERRQVGIALEEAIKNAFHHGNLELDPSLLENDQQAYFQLVQERTASKPFSDRRIEISAEYNLEKAVFSISDEGKGFDHALLQDFSDPFLFSRNRGRGIHLMHQIMDTVEYSEKGNIVRLVKRSPDGTHELTEDSGDPGVPNL